MHHLVDRALIRFAVVVLLGTGVVRTSMAAQPLQPRLVAQETDEFNRLRRDGFNALYNYVGPTLWDYSATAARLRYRDARETVNLGFTYRHRPSLTVFVDAANVFNTPQDYYRGVTDRTERVTFNGTALVFGISGAF